MFGLFSNPKEKLEKKYQQLMTESHRLSTIDRMKSDQVLAEANSILQKIEALEAEENR